MIGAARMVLNDSGGMKRWIVIAIIVAGAATAHADGARTSCVRVSAASDSDAAELQRALVAELPTVRACLDVVLVGIDLVDDGAQVALTARLRVVVSDGDHIAAVVAGRATLHAAKREARRRRSMLQRDVLDEVVASVMPAVRAKLGK